ncbi:MAG: hypothetical protein V7K97_22770 [Nostoc sp.]
MPNLLTISGLGIINIKQALEKLKLQPEQQDLVKGIAQFTNLKMKAI